MSDRIFHLFFSPSLSLCIIFMFFFYVLSLLYLSLDNLCIYLHHSQLSTVFRSRRRIGYCCSWYWYSCCVNKIRKSISPSAQPIVCTENIPSHQFSTTNEQAAWDVRGVCKSFLLQNHLFITILGSKF